MKQFASQEYTGAIGSGVGDAGDLWREISLSLELAGGQIWWCVSRPVVSHYGHEASIIQAPQEGIMIWWQGVHPNDAPAEALAKALNAEGIAAGSGRVMNVGHPNTVVIQIGPKPQK